MSDEYSIVDNPLMSVAHETVTCRWCSARVVVYKATWHAQSQSWSCVSCSAFDPDSTVVCPLDCEECGSWWPENEFVDCRECRECVCPECFEIRHATFECMTTTVEQEQYQREMDYERTRRL